MPPPVRPVTSRCRVFGEGCRRLPAAVSLVAVLMGLNLLDVVRLRLPSLDVDVRQLGMPPLAQVGPLPQWRTRDSSHHATARGDC